MRFFRLIVRNVVSLAVWLGFGFLVQYFCYQDIPVGALVTATTPISVYAHILLWPLFLIWFLLKTVFVWFVLAVLLIVGGIYVASLFQKWTWKRQAKARLAKRFELRHR